MTDSAAAPWFYSIFAGTTREHCLEALGPHAFDLTAAQIVTMLHEAGYHPDILDPSREPLPAPGVTTRLVDNKGRCFLVSIDPIDGVIAVQERVGEPYPDA